MGGLAAWRLAEKGATSRPGRVHLVGMGPRRARMAAGRLASSLPDGLPVVVMGVGGALTGGYVPGDLVVATALGMAEVSDRSDLEVSVEPVALNETSAELSDRLAAELELFKVHRVPLLSAERTARGEEREALHAASGAVICDTESAWLARLADRRPFAVIRTVVDTPERELMSLGTLTGGVAGLRRLEQAAHVVAGCLSASRPA